MSRLKEFISDRIGWEPHLRPFLYKRLPPDLGWPATLGSLCALLFAIQAVSGIFLAMYYSPSPDSAYQSIHYIIHHVPMGRILHGIHHWSAGAMVIAVFLHMVSGFFSGSFRAPRELTWIAGVCLLLITLGLGFTGYLLPWDQKAYWATVVSSNIPAEIPIVGRITAKIMLAGDRVSGFTLTRFYALHMLALPAVLMLLTVFHVYLVRIHGIADHPVPYGSGGKGKRGEGRLYRFFPEHLAKSAVVFAAVFSVIFLLSIFAEVPREKIAGTVDETYLPRPEWYFMWLFQLLTFFSGQTEMIGSIVVPVGIVFILFTLPFWTLSNLRAIADRPFGAAAGVSCIVGVVFLTWMGMAGARPYGETALVPARSLTPSEAKGLYVFVERECAYCHQILGKGGRKEGPDLSNVVAKGRTKEWLMRYIKEPAAVARWTTMPKYGLSEEELDGLADFILSLDFERFEPTVVHRKDVIGGGGATSKR
jgi:ubiquinol-cytochrome c reductase cytochrome b subunit